jgi:SPP1 family predicted phage head-tail adaptor
MLNHRITLRKRTAVRDAAGQPVEAWADAGSIFADVRFQSGAEVLRAGAETSVVRISVRIRARKDVDATVRVKYQGVEYDVKSALPDADRSFMFLVCEGTK